jgi:hypothetical protein
MRDNEALGKPFEFFRVERERDDGVLADRLRLCGLPGLALAAHQCSTADGQCQECFASGGFHFSPRSFRVSQLQGMMIQLNHAAQWAIERQISPSL